MKQIFDNTPAFKFSYDAVSNKSRRRAPTTDKKSEFFVIKDKDRTKLSATVYDLIRNEPTARWAYNKYLDYTTRFYFQSRSKDAEFNRALEAAMWDWGKKKNCDVAGRNSLAEMIRLFGSGICLDGDAGLLKTGNYQLQGIEADRIKTPTDWNKDKSAETKYKGAESGLVIDKTGRVVAYLICDRKKETGKAEIFSLAASYEELIFEGNFFRFDQSRGVAMFAPAVNIWQDLKEIDEYQLIKCKKHAMFGLLLKSADKASGFNETKTQVGTDDAGNAINEFMADMEAGIKIEGGENDGVEMFESRNPSAEYQQYSELMLRKAFSTFFIPYTYFDSRQSTYSAAKMDRAEFSTSVKTLREKIQSALEDITEWILPKLIDDYEIPLPADGKDPALLNWEWVTEGEPWLDEKAEIEAAGLRVAYGLSSRQLEARRRGLDFFDIARDLETEEAFIQEKNLAISMPNPGSNTVNEKKSGDTQNAEK